MDNEWKDITTAPLGKSIELGGWHSSSRSELEWWNETNTRKLFWWKTTCYSWLTHWRDLPEPPLKNKKESEK